MTPSDIESINRRMAEATDVEVAEQQIILARQYLNAGLITDDDFKPFQKAYYEALARHEARKGEG